MTGARLGFLFVARYEIGFRESRINRHPINRLADLQRRTSER